MGAVNFSIDINLITALKGVLPLDVFVETGTFEGDSIELIKNIFTEIYTIEFSIEYYYKSQARFADSEHINVIHGESSSILKTISPELHAKSVLYFLDAHWCEAKNTAGKTSQCPLLQEIGSIGSLNAQSLIIIDDARLFLSPPPRPHEISHWPDFDEVLAALHSISNNHKLMVLNDTIIYYSKSISEEILYYAHTYGIDWLEVTHKIKDYDNLSHQFIGLNNQLAEKEVEIKRLVTALNQYQLYGGSAVSFGSEALAATLPADQLDDESLLAQLAEKTARIKNLMADLSAAQTVQIEKEEVIRALANAVRAYRLGYMAINPLGMLLKPFGIVARHGRAMLRPRLGNLNQHPPHELKLPSPYSTNLPVERLPSISIVTPSFMQAHFLGRTIDSVLDQRYPKLEYFVQDGGSSDETTEVLRHYGDRLTGWVSEKDGGQSHAINLGFARTGGEIMAWLNSDDLLMPGSLCRVGEYFAQHPDVDVIYGHRILIDEQDREIGRWVLPAHDDGVLSWADFIPQETLFWRRSIWEKAGGRVDESFRFAMDWDLLLRLRDAGARMVRLPWFLGAFRIHEAQKTSAQIEVGMAEMDRLRARVFGRDVTWQQTRRKLMPYMLKHVAHDLAYRITR